jgi:futalosine hydrolase
VAATEAEVSPCVSALRRISDSDARVTRYRTATHDIDVLITGVGMVPTAAWCSRAMSSSQFDLALNFGVCGSFRKSLTPGSVVHVVSDRLVEMGTEDGDSFLTIQQMNLLGADEFPFSGGCLVNRAVPSLEGLAELPGVCGVTVNTVHGDDASIARVIEQFNPDVETMEGAAFMYSCLIHRVPFAQIRAVSNSVERRNRAAWKLDGAITSLNAAALRILK